MKRARNLLHQHQDMGMLLYLLIYGCLSLLFLTDFPFVHSDESWLAGLSRAISEQHSFSVTEPFFDARPRYPHAIKLLFHALQIVFLTLFGYSVWSVRLFSLLAGLGTSWLFYLTAKKLLRSNSFAFFVTIVFSLDLQFLYASHFARQEALILLFLTACLYLFFGTEEPYTIKRMAIAGILTGLSIGFHPNSFLIACALGCCCLAHLLHQKQKKITPLLVYIGVTGLFAAIFVGISYCFDSSFLTHYISNGSAEFGIDASFSDRFSDLGGFFSRLFTRSGGTYYVADLRLSFVLFAFVFSALLLFYFVMRKEESAFSEKVLSLLLCEFGLTTGIFIIGRYSQLSILFLLPAAWLLTALFLSLFDGITKKILCLVLLAAVFLTTAKEVRPYLSGETYDGYLEQVSTYAKPSSQVLGNLNMDFYFESGSLHDYRNLPYVMADSSIAAYIEENQIEYIFYSAELDYYYEHRPYYNTIYGNIMFAAELREYCEQECVLVGSFQNLRYAPRILELIGREDYATVTVYRTAFAEQKQD